MAGAVAGIGSIIGGAAAAVGSAVSPIVSAITAAVGPIVSTIGTIAGGVASALGRALAPILTTVGGLANWMLTSIGQTASSLVATLSNVTGPFIDTLSGAITAIGNAMAPIIQKVTETIHIITRTFYVTIDNLAAPILQPIKAGLEVVKGALEKISQWVSTAFHPSARVAELAAEYPELWELSQGYVDSFAMYLQEAGAVSATEAALLTVPDVIATINQVATLKVLSDLVAGQVKVSDVLDKVAQGQGFATAQAIAELSKSIVTTSVGIMDRVDTDVGILRASIDTFDERLESSMKDYAAQTKAEVLSLVTPKIDLLGTYQQKVIKELARVSRHIEDEAWFAAMLLRFLR